MTITYYHLIIEYTPYLTRPSLLHLVISEDPLDWLARNTAPQLRRYHDAVTITQVRDISEAVYKRHRPSNPPRYDPRYEVQRFDLLDCDYGDSGRPTMENNHAVHQT